MEKGKMDTFISKASEAEAIITKKAGKGSTHGLVSEISAFLTIKPGETEELRAGLLRFHERARRAPFPALQQIGIQDMRHVIFDDGTRLCWITAFDTDWDPYIDDAVDILGAGSWRDWLEHTVEYDADRDGASSASIKRFIQSGQVKATGFFRTFPDLTIGQIRKGQELTKAFDQVLDQPGALEALRNPVLKPLLEMASA
jgi:hypothetical protein